MNTVSCPDRLSVGLVTFDTLTLLFVGDQSAFTWLAEKIEKREEVTSDQFRAAGHALYANVNLKPVERAAARVLNSGGQLFWCISCEESPQYAEQLRSLVGSRFPAHAYLDTSSELQIIASKGEYDPQRIFS